MPAEITVAAADSFLTKTSMERGLHFAAIPGPVGAEVAIQAAIDLLPASIGGEVLILPGTYDLLAPVTINRNNVRIGVMAGANIRAFAGFTGNAMFIFGDGSTIYANVGITGPGAFSSALLDCNANVIRAILFDGPLTQCYVTGFEATGGTGVGCIYFQGVPGGTELRFAVARDLYVHDTVEGILASDVNDVRFIECVVVDMVTKGGTAPQDCLEFSRVTRGRMIGCYCEEPGAGNACIDIFDASEKIILTDNHCRARSDNNTRGMTFTSNTPNVITVSGGIIEGPFVFAIAVPSGTVDDLTIKGVQIRNITGTDGKSISGSGDRWLVTQNNFSDANQEHLVFNGDDIKILDNIFKNSNLTGPATAATINMNAASSRVKLRGNTFLNDQGTPNNDFHVLNPAGVDIIAEGNWSDGNLAAGGRPFQLQNDAALIARFNDTTFFVGEASGTATITTGNTTIVVTHGLDYTPAIQLISVTPTNNLGAASHFWVTNPTSTQFTINVNTDPLGDATFGWVINPKV